MNIMRKDPTYGYLVVPRDYTGLYLYGSDWFDYWVDGSLECSGDMYNQDTMIQVKERYPEAYTALVAVMLSGKCE